MCNLPHAMPVAGERGREKKSSDIQPYKVQTVTQERKFQAREKKKILMHIFFSSIIQNILLFLFLVFFAFAASGVFKCRLINKATFM